MTAAMKEPGGVTLAGARVLVTGATGFLGSHCLAPLVERGFDVVGL